MTIPYKLIQVFDEPSRGYRGNLAAVLELKELPSEAVMQKIAADLAQPATTFIAPATKTNTYDIRWFAPDSEINLCGHGSMAAVAFLKGKAISQTAHFKYRQGTVSGRSLEGSWGEILLPSIPTLEQLVVDEDLAAGLGVDIEAYYRTDNKDIVLLKNETLLHKMKPDFGRLRSRKTFGYAVTAPGDDKDFVSRTLVPHVQQLEDPATGSSHALLTPFWAQKLSKNTMEADQLSTRGGFFKCRLSKQSVGLTGHHTVIASGDINLTPYLK